MCHFILLFLASLILSYCGSPDSDSKKDKLKSDLINRVNDYYTNWEKLDLEKMWEFWSPAEVGSKQEFLDKWKNWNVKVKDFSIMDVQITKDTGKVKINATFVENELEFTETSFDYWKINGGRWVLIDSGRKE